MPSECSEGCRGCCQGKQREGEPPTGACQRSGMYLLGVKHAMGACALPSESHCLYSPVPRNCA